VNLSTITGNVNRTDVNKSKVMDDSLRTILGGDVSPATKATLLKQLDKEMTVSLPGPRTQMDSSREMVGAVGPPSNRQMEGPVGPPDGPQRQQQRPRVEASINDPVTKVVGLILGTPEFQRQ